MFNPTNAFGPFAGKIKKGVKIVPYMCVPNETEWEKLGEYFVTGWESAITGTYADVTANDSWYSILNGAIPHMPVLFDISYQEAFNSFFTVIGKTVDTQITGSKQHKVFVYRG